MKNRQLISAEYAIKECFTHVKLPVLVNATGKSDTFIYKCSNQDEPHEITVRDALLMDRAVYQETGSAPFRDLFCRNAMIVGVGYEPDGSLRDLTLSVQSELGDLANRVRQSVDARSENGVQISGNEKAAIARDLEDIQREINKIYLLLATENADAK